MAVQVALNAPPDCHLGGVFVMSGGGAQELELPSRPSEPLRILVTHSTRDSVVPFSQGQAFARRLVELGHTVRWLAFDGRHELAPVVNDLSRFLRGEDVGVDGASL